MLLAITPVQSVGSQRACKEGASALRAALRSCGDALPPLAALDVVPPRGVLGSAVGRSSGVASESCNQNRRKDMTPAAACVTPRLALAPGCSAATSGGDVGGEGPIGNASSHEFTSRSRASAVSWRHASAGSIDGAAATAATAAAARTVEAGGSDADVPSVALGAPIAVSSGPVDQECVKLGGATAVDVPDAGGVKEGADCRAAADVSMAEIRARRGADDSTCSPVDAAGLGPDASGTDGRATGSCGSLGSIRATGCSCCDVA